MAEGPRINLGSWKHAPESWINVDGSWNAWLSKRPRLRRLAGKVGALPDSTREDAWPRNVVVHDLRRGLPFPDGYAAAVYGSHVLEHLYLADAERLLEECFRVLRPGGVARFVVPDLRAVVEEYLGKARFPESDSKSAVSPPADRLNERLAFRERRPPGGNPAYRAYTALKDFHSHKWMYDAESLTARLEAAGFADVEERGYLDSRIEGIEEVELRTRVIDECGICLEGVKP